MAEATAAGMKRVEEPAKVVKHPDLFEQTEETFNAVAWRAYEIFDSTGRKFGRDLENWLQAERELLHPVALNITEADEAFKVRAEVPGFTEKEIAVAVEKDRLTIATKRLFEGREEAKDRLCRDPLVPNLESCGLSSGNRC